MGTILISSLYYQHELYTCASNFCDKNLQNAFCYTRVLYVVCYMIWCGMLVCVIFRLAPHPKPIHSLANKYVFLCMFLLTRFVLSKAFVCECVTLWDLSIISSVLNSWVDQMVEHPHKGRPPLQRRSPTVLAPIRQSPSPILELTEDTQLELIRVLLKE